MSNYSRTYGGLIWTNHAMDRMAERYLKQDYAWQAYRYPDASHEQGDSGRIEYRKKFGERLVTIIVKQNEKREWIVLSTWVDPPFPGTKDHKKQERYHAYKKASFWGKIWHSLLGQMGI